MDDLDLLDALLSRAETLPEFTSMAPLAVTTEQPLQQSGDEIEEAESRILRRFLESQSASGTDSIDGSDGGVFRSVVVSDWPNAARASRVVDSTMTYPVAASSARDGVPPETVIHLTGHDHVAALTNALGSLTGQVDVLDRWGRLLADVLTGPSRGRLLAAGNGGSAAQAQHLTAELVGRYRADRPPFSAICLTAETSSLTAIANDYPADELFARQVEAHGRPGDVLVLLSTSGRSPNAVTAARRARDCGVTVLALTGPAPNPLAAVADDAVCIDSEWTATVQECHLVALHLLCASFDAAVLVESPRVSTTSHVGVAM